MFCVRRIVSAFIYRFERSLSKVTTCIFLDDSHAGNFEEFDSLDGYSLLQSLII